MEKISDFAKMFGVTAKTLRVYEREGLLMPAYVDKFTKYRYYDENQANEMAQILQLKTLGFSLAEIKDYLSNNMSIENKIEQLLVQKYIIEDILNGLSYYQKNDEQYSAYIKYENTFPIYYKDYIAPKYEDLLPLFLQFYSNFIKSGLRASLPSYSFIEYGDGGYKETNVKARMCVGLKLGTKIKENICLTNPQYYVSTIHKGSIDTFYKPYEFLEGYIREHQLKVIGNPSERFLSNSGMLTIEDSFLVEIRYPIEKPKS